MRLMVIASAAATLATGCAPSPTSGDFTVSNLRLEESGTAPVEVRAIVRTNTPQLQKIPVVVLLRTEDSDGGAFVTSVLLENGTGELLGYAYTEKPIGDNPNAWRKWTVLGYHELSPGQASLQGPISIRRK